MFFFFIFVFLCFFFFYYLAYIEHKFIFLNFTVSQRILNFKPEISITPKMSRGRLGKLPGSVPECYYRTEAILATSLFPNKVQVVL